MDCVKGKTLELLVGPTWIQAQSWEYNLMERSHSVIVDMILGKTHLNQIITNIDLRTLKFNGFLGHPFL